MFGIGTFLKGVSILAVVHPAPTIHKVRYSLIHIMFAIHNLKKKSRYSENERGYAIHIINKGPPLKISVKCFQ